jgi:hypothetical protein
MNGERPPVLAERLFADVIENPLGDLPNEVFVVLDSSDEEPFDLVIRCVRAFFREALPQILGGSVVSHDNALLSRPRAILMRPLISISNLETLLRS